MNFQEFMTDKYVISQWINEGPLTIYVRKTSLLLKDKLGDLQIANLNSHQKGSGALAKFLSDIEPKYDIYFENVMNSRLRAFLKRRGYMKIEWTDPPCFIRRVKETDNGN